jgi:hypothetical protein
MPNQKAKRTHVEMDGKASSRRRNEVQIVAHAVNKDGVTYGRLTPWQISKRDRGLARRRAGKTFKNWAKNNVTPKPDPVIKYSGTPNS